MIVLMKSVLYLSFDNQINYAGMMELVDMRDLGSRASGVGVRVPMPAPQQDGCFKRVAVLIFCRERIFNCF